MPCCSEIKRSDNAGSPENIFDYLFKAVFIVVSAVFMAAAFPFSRVFRAAGIVYSSLVFFNKKFLRDIHAAIRNLNSVKTNCRITARVHLVSPRAAGFLYRNFGYILLGAIFAAAAGILIGVFRHVT